MSRNYSSNAVDTSLTGAMTNVQTTMTVAATSGFPAVPFTIAVDAGGAAQELLLVTNVASLTLTVTRGYDSTVAVAHDPGAVVRHVHSAKDFKDSRDHEAATAAHGISGAVVGTTDTQTLTNKTLADPAFSGLAWESYTPAIASGGTTGNAVCTGGYRTIGKTVHFWAKIELGTTSSFGTSPTVSLPIAARTTISYATLSGTMVDQGSGYYGAGAGLASTTAAVPYVTLGSGGLAPLTATLPFTWVAGDILEMRGTYEAA